MGPSSIKDHQTMAEVQNDVHQLPSALQGELLIWLSIVHQMKFKVPSPGLANLWGRALLLLPQHSVPAPLTVLIRLKPPWGAKPIALILVQCLAQNRLTKCLQSMNEPSVFMPTYWTPPVSLTGGSTSMWRGHRGRAGEQEILLLALPLTKRMTLEDRWVIKTLNKKSPQQGIRIIFSIILKFLILSLLLQHTIIICVSSWSRFNLHWFSSMWMKQLPFQ